MTEELQTPWYRDERLLFATMALLLASTLLWKGTEPEDRPIVEPEVTTVLPDLPSPRSLTPYSPDAIDYFLEVAFGSEHGQTPDRIFKWKQDIRIRISGRPTREDLATLQQVIDTINETQHTIRLSLERFSTNLVIYFVPEQRFAEIEPHYRSINPGFFWVHWGDYEIYRARVLIDSERLNQEDRSALIKEELTQSLGLMNVSNRYTDSIFNDYVDHYVSDYAPIDLLMIEMLYRPEIMPGMNRDDVQALFYRLGEQGSANDE
jgi:hypothetical protein